MTREQAEKWIEKHQKKPCLFNYGKSEEFSWFQLEPNSRDLLPGEVWSNLAKRNATGSADYRTEAEAIEDLIQALEKLDEPEVNIEKLEQRAEMWDQLHAREYPNARDGYKAGWLAGYEAAKRGER